MKYVCKLETIFLAAKVMKSGNANY